MMYKQKFDTPMGPPLSPVIADTVLQDLEIKAVENYVNEIPFYYRYLNCSFSPKNKWLIKKIQFISS